MKRIILLIAVLATTFALGQAPLKKKHRAQDQDSSLCVNDGGVEKCLTIDGPTASVITPADLALGIPSNGGKGIRFYKGSPSDTQGGASITVSGTNNQILNIDVDPTNTSSFGEINLKMNGTTVLTINEAGEPTFNGGLDVSGAFVGDTIETISGSGTGLNSGSPTATIFTPSSGHIFNCVSVITGGSGVGASHAAFITKGGTNVGIREVNASTVGQWSDDGSGNIRLTSSSGSTSSYVYSCVRMR